MKKKVFIDGDDLNVISELENAFRKENYNVFTGHDSDEINEKIEEIKPDLTVLVFDVQVNLSICRRIKSGRQAVGTALIIVGGKETDDDKHDIIEGLRLGVEDYMQKPIDPDIFIAKVKAIMRRLDFREEPDKILTYQNLEINLTSHTVSINKKRIKSISSI